jgi:hypothetical protein
MKIGFIGLGRMGGVEEVFSLSDVTLLSLKNLGIAQA